MNNNDKMKNERDIEQENNMIQDKINRKNKIIERIINFKRNMTKSFIINLFISTVLTLLIYMISPLIYGVYPTIFICIPGIFLATIILFLPDYLKEKRIINSYDIEKLNKEIISLTNSIELNKNKLLVNDKDNFKSSINYCNLTPDSNHLPSHNQGMIRILEKKNTNH